MKLVISKAVVNGVVTRLGQLGFKFAVEFESATGEKVNSNGTNPLSDIPLFHKIENVLIPYQQGSLFRPLPMILLIVATLS